MIYRYLFSIFLCAILFDATSAAALTCRNDYAGASGCASNVAAAGDCVTLGYSKTDNADCGHYILCPFDSSYKMCVSQKCTNYTLAACPENGVCVSCQSGDTITYAFVDCKDGFIEGTDNTCVAVYSSCRAAGYYDDNTLRTCESITHITLPDGSSKMCYVNCVCGGGYEEDESGQCVPQQCPENTSVNTTCVGNAIAVPSGSYSGSNVCYECKTCNEGYTTDVELCGFGGAAGWTLSSTDKDSVGCSKCIAKECPSGSEVNKQCKTGQNKVFTGYSGNSRCYKCTGTATVTCPDGQYPTQAECEEAVGSTCMKVLGGDCWQKRITINPCNGLSGCAYCTCMNKSYYCPSGCSDTNILGSNGIQCISCSATTGGGSSTGGSSTGGGSSGGSSCNSLTMDDCEYKKCVDRNYCTSGAGSGGMDPMCCGINQEVGSTGGGTTTINP